MSGSLTWACLLLWVGLASQDKTPDSAVTCLVSEDCFLPCAFRPGGAETVEWFRQDVVVYRFQRSDADQEDKDDEDEDDDDGGDEVRKESVQHSPLAGRASVSPQLVSRGNATLTLRRSGLKDRGTYRCRVQTAEGQHDATVIVKVEAPIRGLFLELSRLSGYEEMKCTVRHVFPPPRVTWETEPPTFESLRPVTRMLADSQGLYTVDSRLRRLTGLPDLLYVCRVTTSYGGQAWTASLREREIKGNQGKDLNIPCSAPTYLNGPSLRWSFSNGEDSSHIVSYDSRSGQSFSTPPWDARVELDGFRVPFGDGSLRLMDPEHSKHTGSYTCVFSVPRGTHTERNAVTIDGPAGQRSKSGGASHWWVLALVIALLILGLAGLLIYLRLKGRKSKASRDPEETTELHGVKDGGAESCPLTPGGTNGSSAATPPI